MTIRLNERLATIASYITPGESVCDIGTDHGYLPIWLAEQGVYGKIIMSDVSRGSLDKAIADAEDALERDDRPEARYGDGLDVLAPGEVDDIVIAGMGGRQILDILSWDFIKTLSYRKFILQPRRDAALLRKWFEMNDFTIEDQSVAPENGRFSEIICVTSKKAYLKDIYFYDGVSAAYICKVVFNDDPDEMARYEYPDGLRDPSGKGVDLEYYKSELNKTMMIISRIRENTEGQNEALRLHEARLRRLEMIVEQNKADGTI